MPKLGKYDFDRFQIFPKQHNDPSLQRISTQHEHVHHILSVTTNYGTMLREAKRVGANSNNSSDKYILSILVANCVAVQEMMATYDSLIRHRREDIISSLPIAISDALSLCEILSPHFLTYPFLSSN